MGNHHHIKGGINGEYEPRRIDPTLKRKHAIEVETVKAMFRQSQYMENRNEKAFWLKQAAYWSERGNADKAQECRAEAERV